MKKLPPEYAVSSLRTKWLFILIFSIIVLLIATSGCTVTRHYPIEEIGWAVLIKYEPLDKQGAYEIIWKDSRGADRHTLTHDTTIYKVGYVLDKTFIRR